MRILKNGSLKKEFDIEAIFSESDRLCHENLSLKYEFGESKKENDRLTSKN